MELVRRWVATGRVQNMGGRMREYEEVRRKERQNSEAGSYILRGAGGHG